MIALLYYYHRLSIAQAHFELTHARYYQAYHLAFLKLAHYFDLPFYLIQTLNELSQSDLTKKTYFALAACLDTWENESQREEMRRILEIYHVPEQDLNTSIPLWDELRIDTLIKEYLAGVSQEALIKYSHASFSEFIDPLMQTISNRIRLHAQTRRAQHPLSSSYTENHALKISPTDTPSSLVPSSFGLTVSSQDVAWKVAPPLCVHDNSAQAITLLYHTFLFTFDPCIKDHVKRNLITAIHQSPHTLPAIDSMMAILGQAVDPDIVYSIYEALLLPLNDPSDINTMTYRIREWIKKIGEHIVPLRTLCLFRLDQANRVLRYITQHIRLNAALLYPQKSDTWFEEYLFQALEKETDPFIRGRLITDIWNV